SGTGNPRPGSTTSCKSKMLDGPARRRVQLSSGQGRRRPPRCPVSSTRSCPAMLAELTAFALVGIDAVLVEVEVDAAAGLPKTIPVGRPGPGRVRGRPPHGARPGNPRLPVPRGAHHSESGHRRSKDAGAFDLPIALGMLVATGQLLPEQLRDF